MTDFLRDLRHGFRALRARPLFLAAAVATLALGIGASTGVFSVIRAALLRPLPFPDADRLTVVWGVAGPDRDVRGASPIEIRDWDGMVDALGPLARYSATTLNLSGEGDAAQLAAETVGPEFFGVLGVSPALGRGFTAEDDVPGAAFTIVISDNLWRTRFDGDPDVVGRMLRLDGLPRQVVGVMPRGFRGLTFDTDVWLPLGAYLSEGAMNARGGRWLAAIGRLEPGRTPDEAQAQLTTAALRLEELYPDSNRDRGAMLLSLRDFYVAQTRPLLLMVLGGVGLLLLIACANVANLQIVRGLERGREVALRYALGAGRGRVGRQVLAESLVLGLLGAAAGIALAGVLVGALLPLVPDGVLPPYARPGLDPAVLLFALGAGIVTAAVFGLLPALRAASQDPATALRGAGRGITAGRPARGAGAQQVIVAAEVALALVLLVGAGLALRSLREQLEIRPGFDAEGVLAARLALPSESYDGAGRIAFVDRLIEEVSAVPGVTRATVVSNAPLRGYNAASILRAPEDLERDVRYYRHIVTPGFFEQLGIAVRGRTFTSADGPDAPGVAVVSEALALRLWPDQEAIGRRVLLGSRDTVTVIGVAASVRYRDLTTSLMDPGEDPDVYFAYAQIPSSSFDVLLETTGDPGALTASLRDVVRRLDPALPLYDVRPMTDVLAAQTALGRMVSAFLAVFGGLALIVSAVGLYGVLAFVVRGRRREIAIRQALGARPAEIRRMVVRQALRLVAAGLVAGLGVALVAGRVAASLLYGVSAADPVVLAVTVGGLLLVGAVASWIPARQATGVQPHTAMAAE